MDDQLNSGPDLQSAEDEDVDYDLINNSSDNDEDWADRMREFHVSSSGLRYVALHSKCLQLEGQDLQRYGKTSIFQYAPVPPGSRSRFPDIVEDDRCYVLLVDGVDQSKYNPDFDWSRHLPNTVEMNRWEHDKYDRSPTRRWSPC